ncbi:hypothetical protein NO1_2122 [Candidatus Termititenax aidoneus]|uniref:Uncharacterized protein n=1 Tax=Termititenax aidoneus TaxID=2218524 RepID=A0A388TEI2_TERA1|nr:hypothetical protein NO1_2122 [Candidatus Termititenax aidoneus]
MVEVKINDGEEAAQKQPDAEEEKKPEVKPPPPEEISEIDLHELQIKLEKVKSYIKRTEMRINANELNLQRLRERQQAREDKRMNATLAPRKNKTENQV